MHTAIGEDTMLIPNMALLTIWKSPGLEVNLIPSLLYHAMPSWKWLENAQTHYAKVEANLEQNCSVRKKDI